MSSTAIREALAELTAQVLFVLDVTVPQTSQQREVWPELRRRALAARAALSDQAQQAGPVAGSIPLGREVEQSLAVMIVRLVRRMRKVKPDDDLAATALDYVQRLGLPFSPLRAAPQAAQPGVSEAALRWCNYCGEGVTDFCRARPKTDRCPTLAAQAGSKTP